MSFWTLQRFTTEKILRMW